MSEEIKNESGCECKAAEVGMEIKKDFKISLNTILYIAGVVITLGAAIGTLRSCTNYGFQNFEKPKIEMVAKTLDSVNNIVNDEKVDKIADKIEHMNTNVNDLKLKTDMTYNVLKQVASDKQWKTAQEKTKQDSANAMWLAGGR